MNSSIQNNEILRKIISEIKNYCKDEELNEIQDLLNKYFNLLNNNLTFSKDGFNEIKQKLFSYEKRILPEIESHKEIRNNLKPDVVITTVGMQKEPIILSLLILKPKIVYLLYTEQSITTVYQIMNDEDIKNLIQNLHLKQISESDLKENYKIIVEIVEKNSDKKIVCDPTGGRKMMNTSLSLLSLYFRLNMVYLSGIELNRNIVPFSERLLLIENPFEIYGDIELEFIQELFNSHFYEAAIKVCENLMSNVKDIETLKKLELLKDLIEVYSDWDKFEHSNPYKKPDLRERLNNIKENFEKFKISKYLPENIENNIKFLEELEKSWVEGKLNMIDEYRIIDTFLNAQRRGTKKQGKYDDAIARLYRIIEMINTYYLLKFGIKSTEEPDYENLTKNINVNLDEFKAKFKEICNYDLPDKTIGLDNQKNILKVINNYLKRENIEEIIKIQESDKFIELIKKRNRSILAHGTISLNEDDWVTFRDKVKVLLIKIFGENKYNELMKLGSHGQIHLFDFIK